MRSLPRGWQAAVLYAVSFAQAGAYVSLPASSAVLYGFGLSKTAYGSLFLPMILMAALAAATGPRLARRCGLRWLYRASHLGNVCMLAVLWNSPSIDPRYLALFLAGGSLVLGLSLGWMGVVANATISSLYPRRRSIALSGLHATLGVGATLTPALYGVLIASGRWSVGPQIFGATSGLFLLGSILAPSALAFPDEEPGRREGVTGRSALRGHALRAGLYGAGRVDRRQLGRALSGGNT
ncbi:MAG: MFS transporter [Candidatus Eisenbacteria bacterium]